MTETQKRVDLALAGICGMLVIGFIFFAFGLAGWFFFSPSVAWTFWVTGFGCWILALGIFIFFMSSPYPRHRWQR